jgi:hypothetical protein
MINKKCWCYYYNTNTFPPEQAIYFLTEQVLMPTKAYKGQKLTTLVRRKIPAKTSPIMPKVPLIVPL